jgi:hypothetical protein
VRKSATVRFTITPWPGRVSDQATNAGETGSPSNAPGTGSGGVSKTSASSSTRPQSGPSTGPSRSSTVTARMVGFVVSRYGVR